MAEIVNEAVIRVTADASGVDAGLRRVDESAARTGRNLENLGRQPGIRNIGEGANAAATSVEAGMRRVDESTTRTGRNMVDLSRQPGLRNLGDGADAAATRIDRSTRNMADSIQRTTAAMQAGSRGTADYFRALASQRGLDANALRPYLQQLEAVTRQTEEAAQAQRRLDEGTRFLADLRTRADGIGRTASQLAEMRAAQLGVSDAAGPLIARLRQAEQGATGFAAVIVRAKAALAGLAVGAAFVAIAHEVVDAQRGFDKLNASLETATGSSKRAGEAFKALQAFAATTPYDLKQTTEAFLELRNLGLTPSERALTSFGNTAAAKSKELKDVVAAVADAATGEFERLKEAFGITSQQIGDKVAFTFQGTTTLVQKDAKAIEEYLTRIGEVQFGGAMQRQADTLNGAIGQLGDTWDSVMRSIATNGSGEAIRSVVLALGGALQDLGDIIDAVGGKAADEGAAIKESVGVHQVLTATFKGIAIAGVIAVGAFKEVGQEIAALAAAGTLLVQGDLKGVKAVLEARRLDAESLSVWVSNKIKAITGAADTAAAAGNAEVASAKKNSNDRLAQYAIELTADQKRVKAKQDIADIEKRLTGVDPQTASDLKKLKDALDAGAISQKEYAAFTTKINEEALKGTSAYKDQIKQLDLSAVAIRNRAEALAFANAREREHLEFLRRTGQMAEDDYISQSADSDVKALEDQKKNLEAQRDIAKKKIDNKQQVKELDGQIDSIDRQIAARRMKESDDQFELDQKRYRAAADNYADLLEASQAETKSQQDRVRDAQDEIDMLGMTSKQIAEVSAQRLRDQAAMLEQRAAIQDLTDWTGRLGDESRKQAQALREQADLKVSGAAKQELYDKPLQDLNAMVDILGALDEAAQSAAQGMASAFGSVGQAIGSMTTALTGYERTQAAIAAQLANATRDAHGDPVKVQRANQMAAEASAQAQIKSYGDMAAAAKGFFDQNSKGYAVLGGIEKAYRAAEMVMALKSMTKKIFFKETEVAATTALNATKLNGEAATTEASTGLAATEASAWGITAVVKALASLPFPMNLAAGAATLAAVVAVGAQMFGSVGAGSVSLSEQRQQDQGKGTVLGDSDAKSESIKRALDAVEKNTYQDLAINSSMLATLRSIDTNISNFAGQLVRSTDITNPDVGTLNSNNGLGKSIASWAAGGVVIGSLLAKIPALGNIFGKVGTSIFGGKQSVEDSGFTMDATSLATILGSGAKAFQYADIKTSGGWFGKDKLSEQTTPLSEAANQQFTAIIKSLADSVKTAGDLLGLSGDDFTNKLNSFVVDIGEVSLKGLKGEDLQKAVESVFAKLGDQMAQFAVDGLGSFQQVGEGYLETLSRIAAEYQTIDVVFQSFGKTFGEVGLASVAARDRLVQLAGGLDEFTSQGEYFLQNFFTEQEQAASLKARISPTLAKYGLSTDGEDASKLFRDLVVGLDTTKEAGAAAYTELMSIAPAFKAVVDSRQDALDEQKELQDQLDELTMSSTQLLAKQRDALYESNRALFDQVQALKAVKDSASTLLGGVDNAFAALQKVVAREKTAVQASVTAQTAAVAKLQTLSQALRSTLDSLKSPDQKAAERVSAQAQIRAALAIAKAGGALPTADSLKAALSAVTQDAADQFSSSTDYLRDLYQTQNDLSQLADITDNSLSVEQQSLDALQAQLTRLDDMVAQGQEQIDVLKGQSVATLTLAQAMAGLKTAILGAQSNPIVGATSGIASMYQQLLGRAPDQAGLEYWQNAIAGGSTLDSIRDAIMQSLEYKSLHPFAIGTNSVPEDMPAFIHKGERIIPAADNRALMARLASPQGNTEALVAEVRALRDTVARQQAALDRIASNTKEHKDMFEQSTGGGGPLLVEIA